MPEPVPPATHLFKYRLFYGKPRRRVISYDNERGKGDHKHIRGTEVPYEFVSVSVLLEDFKADVEEVTGKKL